MTWLPTWLQPTPKPDTQDSVKATTQTGTIQHTTPHPSTSTLPAVEVQNDVTAPQQTSSSQYDMNEEQENFFRHGPEMAIPMTGATLGFIAGFYTAATKSGLVFMAENAHRRPNTVQGWYFYNKTKVS